MTIEMIDPRVREALRDEELYGEDMKRFLDSRARLEADAAGLLDRARHDARRLRRHEHDAQRVGALVAGACFVVLVGLVVALVLAP